MHIIHTDVPLTQIQADALVVGLFSEDKPAGAAAQIDQAAGGLLSRLIEAREVAGKLFELTPLYGVQGVAAPVTVVVGLGPRHEFDCGRAFRTAATAAKFLAAKRRARVAFCLSEEGPESFLESAVAGAVVGCHGQDLYRAEKQRHPFEEIEWRTADGVPLQRGKILGESVNLTRHLVDEPPQEIYPASFCARAGELVVECGLEIEAWDEDRLRQERAGALLAVARGSNRPPRLLVMRHRGGDPDAAPLVFVGKGVTFDSGGLSLKPTDSMKTMKCDMAGAAIVVGAMRAIALLNLPLNVVGLAGLVENMPSGSAMKLGDVLTARNGRTIEVQNTDAEGRLVLADVLDVAVEMGAAKIVDLATLTGACVVALGTDVAGLMSNDQAWCDEVATAARSCGEPVWQLPMFAEYAESIKSDVADIRNTGEGRWGGAIAAAKFLEEFVARRPWAHLDIAGPAFLEKPKPWLDGGASGAFVRTLVELARNYADAIHQEA